MCCLLLHCGCKAGHLMSHITPKTREQPHAGILPFSSHRSHPPNQTHSKNYSRWQGSGRHSSPPALLAQTGSINKHHRHHQHTQTDTTPCWMAAARHCHLSAVCPFMTLYLLPMLAKRLSTGLAVALVLVASLPMPATLQAGNSSRTICQPAIPRQPKGCFTRA